MDNIFKELADLVTKSYDLNDEQLAEEVHKITQKIPANLMVHTAPLDKVLQRRVYSHCRLHNLKPEDYKGPLPFRVFKIQTQ